MKVLCRVVYIDALDSGHKTFKEIYVWIIGREWNLSIF